MARLPSMLIGAGAGLLFAHAACAADDCASSLDPAVSIPACTRVLESGAISADVRLNALIRRGYAYRLTHDANRAIADYTEAIKLNPRSVQSHINRANAYLDKQAYDEAVADDTVALTLDPKHFTAWYNRGDVYLKKQAFDLAIADYTMALNLLPEQPADLKNRRVANVLDPAVGYLEAGTRSVHAAVLMSRGSAHANQDAYEEAIAHYTGAIANGPNDTGSLENRGAVYLLKGQLDKAIADEDAAIKLDPKPSSR